MMLGVKYSNGFNPFSASPKSFHFPSRSALDDVDAAEPPMLSNRLDCFCFLALLAGKPPPVEDLFMLI